MPLIVLEGIDGCGKSTQLQLLLERLRQAGCEPLALREPGGTALGERLREVLLDPATRAEPLAEVFLYQAARAQLVAETIRPALAAGRLIVLDRFWQSTMAYQAEGLDLDRAGVRAAIALAVAEVRADAAIYLRIAPRVAAERRRAEGDDRIEARGLAYQERVAAGYEALVAAGELHPVAADAGPATVAATIWAHCRERLPSLPD